MSWFNKAALSKAFCTCSVVCSLCGCGVSISHAAPAGSQLGDVPPEEMSPPKLIKPVVPEYPSDFKVQNQHGDVYLLVTVGPVGEVVSVEIEKGPDVFHEVAKQAARRMQFEPALLNGLPVTVKTRVWFHFAPPEIEDDSVLEIVVFGRTEDKRDTHARTTLQADDLQESVGVGLAETLSQVPGVTMATGTTNAAKPMIRGLRERRLLVLYDGVRHESQKWGPDHATEIDPYAAGSISVVRGAAGARYGADAMAGVILVEPPRMRQSVGYNGQIVGAFFSNGAQPYGALRLDVVPEKRKHLSFRAEGNYAQTASLQTPNYTLGNTGSTVWNTGLSMESRHSWGSVRINAHHYDTTAGLFYGVMLSSPSEFEAQLNSDQPLNADLWSPTYTVDRPYQTVTHDIVNAHINITGEAGEIELTYAYQHNHREEFEQVRTTITGPQFDFTLRTHTLDVLYKHPRKSLSFAIAEGGLGVQGMFQENVYRGYSLIPNYRSFSGSVFGFERVDFENFEVEVGGRYDAMGRTAYLSSYDYSGHESAGSLSADECEVGDEKAICPMYYDAVSATLGGRSSIVEDTLDVKVNLSTASRFPNVDELFLLGYAPSFPIYALGRPDLKVETAYSGSLTMGYYADWIDAEASTHASYVDNYIHFAPVIGSNGLPSYEMTIRGTYPLYEYRPIQATVFGFDGHVRIGGDSKYFLEATPALVRAVDVSDQTGLVGTPPDRLGLSLGVQSSGMKYVGNSELKILFDLVAKQKNVVSENDFAPAPDAYVLAGFAAHTNWKTGDRKMRLSLEARNVLNTTYRDYTSLNRYYADNLGRDVRLRFMSQL